MTPLAAHYRTVLRRRVETASREHVTKELSACEVAGPASWPRENQILQEACQRLGLLTVPELYVCEGQGAERGYVLPPVAVVLHRAEIREMSADEVRVKEARGRQSSPTLADRLTFGRPRR